jgi:hypothetical protein
MAWRGVIGAVALALGSGETSAIDRVVLEVGELSVAGARVSGATVALDLSGGVPTVAMKGDRLELREPRTVLSHLSVACTELAVKEPQLACSRAHITVLGGPTKAIDLQAAVRYDTEKRALTFAGSDLAIAGGHLRFTGQLGPAGWSVQGHAAALQATQVRKLMAPWVTIPKTYSVDGDLDVDMEASRRAGALLLKLDARAAAINFTNEPGTIVTEKVAARVIGSALQTGRGFEIEANVESGAGQALAGPVLLDFGANPLKLAVSGKLIGSTVELDEIAIAQKDLLTAHAEAHVRLDAKPTIPHARLDITDMRFPAAYTSFLQIALAATDFGTLEASGTARGAVEISNDRLASIDVRIDGLDLNDDKTQFMMSDLRGDLHWVPDVARPVEASRLTWSKVRAYGLSGGTAQLDLLARGLGFELTREARVPVFDGVVVVHSFAARNLARGEAELDFDAHVEPISMSLLSKAFGWPELSGQLAGRIPGLTYRNHLLTFNGAFTANVFDGTITGSNFRLQDPLGPWPRLFADVTARRLDLELVTSTFSIGSITGRLDADLKGMELFNWSPVAFDARLYSTPRDRSPHLISQKAVTSISSIGGGTSGVTKALQSGVLRFFDRFRYDRIGINCQLRNEVCLMTGVEPHGEGYYIVKGWGIPRIDIIGNAGRVDWPQLVTQIVQGMRSENVIVR